MCLKLTHPPMLRGTGSSRKVKNLNRKNAAACFKSWLFQMASRRACWGYALRVEHLCRSLQK